MCYQGRQDMVSYQGPTLTRSNESSSWPSILKNFKEDWTMQWRGKIETVAWSLRKHPMLIKRVFNMAINLKKQVIQLYVKDWYRRPELIQLFKTAMADTTSENSWLLGSLKEQTKTNLKKLQRRLDNAVKRENGNGCLIFEITPDADGYVKLSIRKLDVNRGVKFSSSISLQKAVLLCSHGLQDFQPGMEASHLCHNPK